MPPIATVCHMRSFMNNRPSGWRIAVSRGQMADLQLALIVGSLSRAHPGLQLVLSWWAKHPSRRENSSQRDQRAKKGKKGEAYC